MKNIYILDDNLIASIKDDLKLGKPYLFENRMLFMIMTRLYSIDHEISLWDTVKHIQSQSRRNETIKKLTKKLVENYITEVLKEFTLDFDFREDSREELELYIKRTDYKNSSRNYSSSDSDVNWGLSPADELGLFTNNRTMVIFEYGNTVISYKQLDEMLDKVHKYFEPKGKVVSHNHKKQDQIYKDNMLLLSKYLGNAWGGIVTFRDPIVLRNGEIEGETQKMDTNDILVIEFIKKKEVSEDGKDN